MQIKLYTPTEPQLDFEHLANRDKPFMSIIAAGRQVGKSYWLMMDALSRAMNNDKCRIMIVSPIQIQSNKIQSQMEALFQGRDEVFNLIFKRWDRKHNEIYLKNGSFIKFRSADSGDNLRGATLDFIYLDEAAFMKLDFINTVMLPMVTRTGGRIAMTSTFNGKNWYWDYYQKGQDPANWASIKSVKRTYKDLNDPEVDKVVEAMRKSMTAAEFAQEVLAEPTSADALFSNIELCTHREPVRDYERVYIGMDIGVAQDYTVLTAMTEDYKVIDIHRFNYKEEDLDYGEFKQRIVDFYKKHDEKLMAAYFEVNNNDLLFDDLTEDETLYKLVPFHTTAQSKPDIVRNLVKVFEEQIISIPDDLELKKELYDFKSKRNAITGNLQFSNTDGRHDDMVMSLAIAAWCCKEEQDGGVMMFL